MIIDASVALKWFVKEEDSEKALSLLHSIFSAPENYAVPELFFFEITHVLKKLIKNPSGEQLKLINSIINLGWARFSMTENYYSEITKFQEVGLSGYDASYVALAKILKGRWITCDLKAHRLIARFNLSRVL